MTGRNSQLCILECFRHAEQYKRLSCTKLDCYWYKSIVAFSLHLLFLRRE